MIEFTINGRDFHCEKMNVFDQAHLLSAVSPLVAGIAPLFMLMSKQGGLTADVTTLPELLKPLADALSDMPNEKREKLIGRCLADVKVDHDGRWIPLWNAAAKRSSIEEYNDLFPILKIVIQVVQGNLGNFLSGLLSTGGQSGNPTT